MFDDAMKNHQIVLVLLHSLWQGPVFAVLLWLVLRKFTATKSNLRYITSCVALLALVISCLATWRIIDPYDNSAHTHLDDASSHLLPSDIAAQPESPNTTLSSGQLASSPLIQQGQGQGKGALSVKPQPLETQTEEPAAKRSTPTTWRRRGESITTLAWCVGVVAMLVRVARVLWLGQRIRQFATELEATRFKELNSLVEELKRTMHVGRDIALRVTDRVSVPSVLGIVWPVLLVPPSMLTGIPTEQWRIIFAHELAHIRRYDQLVHLLQLIVEALLFFNPAMWWISQQVRIEREACCDQIAGEVIGNPKAVARTLIDVAGWVQTPPSLGEALPTQSITSARNSKTLLARVRRLAQPDRQPPVRLAWTTVAAATILCAVAVLSTEVGSKAIARSLSLVSSRQVKPSELNPPNAKALTESSGSPPFQDQADPTEGVILRTLAQPQFQPAPLTDAEEALRKAQLADPSYASDYMPQQVAIRTWREFLQRDDLSSEQEAFAWWRIGSLAGTIFDTKRGERADYELATESFAKVRELSGDRINMVSLNTATMFGSLPGQPAERARRMATSYRWLFSRTASMLDESARHINQIGHVVNVPRLPLRSFERRRDILRRALAQRQRTFAERVSQEIVHSEEAGAIREFFELVGPMVRSDHARHWSELVTNNDKLRGDSAWEGFDFEQWRKGRSDNRSAKKMPDETKAGLAGSAVRRLARELGVDISQMVGSGEDGRIQQRDVVQTDLAIRAAKMLVADVRNDIKLGVAADFEIGVDAAALDRVLALPAKRPPHALVEFLARITPPHGVPAEMLTYDVDGEENQFEAAYMWLPERSTQLLSPNQLYDRAVNRRPYYVGWTSTAANQGLLSLADYVLGGDGDTIAYDVETGMVWLEDVGGGPSEIVWGSLLEFVDEHVTIKQAYSRENEQDWRDDEATGTGPGGETKAFLAVWENDDAELNQLINRGVDVNQRDILDRTALHHLCRDSSRKPNMIAALLDAGADVNAQDRYGLTPLALAARVGYLDAVSILIDAGADRSIKDNDGRGPIDVVSRFRNTNEIRRRLAGRRSFYPYRVARVGELFKEGHWANLQLADAQTVLLRKLDYLASDAWDESNRPQKDYHELSIIDRQLALGLLTREQVDYCFHRQFTRGIDGMPQQRQPWNFFDDKYYRDLLSMDQAQYRAFHRAENVPTDLSHKERTRASEAIKANILNDEQLQTWHRLCAEKPRPAAPQALPPLLKSQRPLSKMSPVFQSFEEHAEILKLSSKQKQLLRTLEEIVQQALVWIDHWQKSPYPVGDPRNNVHDPSAVTQSRYIEFAELFALNGILTRDQQALEERARYTKRLSGLILNGVGIHWGYGIGGLVDEPQLKIPLAKEQAEVITKLDKLVSDARDDSVRAVSQYVGGNPSDYREHNLRGQKRRELAELHAQQLVALGLLTKDQEEYSYYRRFSVPSERPWWHVEEEYFRELLAITDEQLQQFRIKLKNPKVLTEEQTRIWNSLRAARPAPPVPTDLTSASSVSSQPALAEVSTIFQAIEEHMKELALTAVQKQHIDELATIVQTALLWSGSRAVGPYLTGDPRNDDDDPVSQTHPRIIHHAEQFALLGILTQQQEDILRN